MWGTNKEGEGGGGGGVEIGNRKKKKEEVSHMKGKMFPEITSCLCLSRGGAPWLLCIPIFEAEQEFLWALDEQLRA